MNPVVLSVFWNSEKNGGRLENVVQYITDDLYYWNCYNCGKVYRESVGSFLAKMISVKGSQFNKKCPDCRVVRNISELTLNNLIKDLEELNFVADEFEKEHREQEFITRCPICGKMHSVKIRSIRRNQSFVCTNCKGKHGGYKFESGVPIKDICPDVEPYWGKTNRHSFLNTYPLVCSQPFDLICPVCGKRHTKSYEAIKRNGAVCEQCARVKHIIRDNGSLFDNYPVLAEMWDRGNNNKSSKEIPPSSTLSGEFVCIEGGVPHKFVRQVSVMRSAFDKGSNGCPICANREVYTGVNDFATKFPKAVGYWDYDGNDLPPEKSLVTNQTKFSMICPRCGKIHTKRSDGVERNGAYCERCSQILSRLDKVESFREAYPVAAKMWDDCDNHIKSDSLTVQSQEKGKFLCPGGRYPGKPHIFIRSVQAVVHSIEASKKSKKEDCKKYNGCPICAGFVVSTGINDFKTMCPNLTKLWDYSRNKRKPEDVYYLSEKKYHFICPEGHDYSKDLLHMARSEKIGATGCPVCKGKEVRPGVNDVATTHKHMMRYWDYNINELDPTTVTAGSNKLIKSHCRFCGKVYETKVYDWVNSLVVACPNCRKRQYSAAEKELCEEIRSWGIEVQENVHLTGDGRTYDIFIPEKNIAVEYNGLYYHSDIIRPDKDYHFKKCSDCLECGIELIQIWEDDYTLKRDIVLRLLKSKLGVSDLRKVNARDCSVFIPQKDEIKPFLEENHIQGYVSGSKYIGLYTVEDELVALMVLEWHKDNKELLIKRYVTSCNVRGGFSKILSLLKEEYPEATGVYTFSDNTISFGDLYKSNGFRSVAFIEPDYSYLVNNVRVHKFNYRKSRFKSDHNLYYEEGMTEAELAYVNGIPRVYDAGKIRWYKEL